MFLVILLILFSQEARLGLFDQGSTIIQHLVKPLN
jgi:hypothetical protein